MIFVYVPKSEIRDLPLSENDRFDFYRTRTLAENDNGRGISIGACALGLISLLPLSLWFSLCLRKLSNVKRRRETVFGTKVQLSKHSVEILMPSAEILQTILQTNELFHQPVPP